MRRLFIALLLASVLLLSGCTVWNQEGKDPKREDFYRGSEGVKMRFVPGSPPPRMFYYPDDPDNSFDVSVELRNEGASDTIGATYISGYPPEFIEVEGTNRQVVGPHDCVVSFGGGIGSNLLGLDFHCDLGGTDVSGWFRDERNMGARLSGIEEFLGIPLDLNFQMNNGQWQTDIGWDMVNDWGALNHGRMLVILLSSLDFNRYNGYPFTTGVEGDGHVSGILRGDNHYHPGGDHGFQNFRAHIYDWPQGLDEFDTTFQVDSCYAYSTYAAPSVCIDPAPYDDRDKVCRPQEYSWSGSQGAPVAITSMKQDSTPKSMILTFTVRNVGGGEVIHPGYLERCSPYYPGKFDARFKDVVYIGDIRIGKQRLSCSPGYKIRLHDGVGSFTCQYDLEFAGSSNAYETPVVAELWYGYHESIKTRTLIKRAG